MLRVGVLASHQGTNFQAVADACATGRLDAAVVVLICNNSAAPVIQRAKNAGVATRHLSSKTYPDPDELDSAIEAALNAAQVDLVVLAGYMRKLGPRVLGQYEDRIINVHPSLLPRHGGPGCYGERVHQAVLDAGDTETGATVHLVKGEYDQGDILQQESTPVLAGDTPESLASRVHAIEHKLLLSTIDQMIKQFTGNQSS